MFLLFLTAVIWGLAFVAQSEGMKDVGTFTFSAVRAVLAVIFLSILSIVTDRMKAKSGTSLNDGGAKKYNVKALVTGGILCGTALFIGTVTQQTGLLYTTVGKSGFITATYMIMVPIFSIFLKKKVTPLLWISVLIALGGMYMLCISDAVAVNKGDLFTLACAVAFSFHIIFIDKYSPQTDSIKLSCVQFAVCAVISTVFMLIFEKPTLEQLRAAAIPIAYAGIMSSGVAFTLQIAAQKNVSPVVATLVMSLESVFAAIFGWIILEQGLSGKEIFGCILVFAAIILSQLPIASLGKKSKSADGGALGA